MAEAGFPNSAVWGYRMRRLVKTITRLLLLVLFTVLTQVGGLAYLVGIATRRSRLGVLTVSLVTYAVMTAVLVPPLAQMYGRVRLACSSSGDGPVVAATWLTCALNRGYIRADALETVNALGRDASIAFPGSKLTTLEGGFPFISGFPLIPHLSHHDGRKVDLAYFYRTAPGGTPIAHGSPSWLGYFIFEQPKAGERISCSRPGMLRWNFYWLQPNPPAWEIDEQRTAWMVRWLKERGSVTRILIEPYLAERMGVDGGKVRFQGCNAARHDDHLHIAVN